MEWDEAREGQTVKASKRFSFFLFLAPVLFRIQALEDPIHCWVARVARWATARRFPMDAYTGYASLALGVSCLSKNHSQHLLENGAEALASPARRAANFGV